MQTIVPKSLGDPFFLPILLLGIKKNGGRNERREFMKLKKNVSSPIQKLDLVSCIKNVKRYFLRILEAEFVRKMQKREINGNLMVIYD